MVNQTNNFQIQEVNTDSQRETFLNLPQKVYQNDPNWVQPLRSSIVKQLAPDNPFTSYGELQQFIAVDEGYGKTLGRIVAAINQRLIEKEGEKIGLFGYFECVENFPIAQALLENTFLSEKTFLNTKITGWNNMITMRAKTKMDHMFVTKQIQNFLRHRWKAENVKLHILITV